MSENNNSEGSPVMNSHEIIENEGREFHRTAHETARGFDSAHPRIIGHKSKSLPKGGYRLEL